MFIDTIMQSIEICEMCTGNSNLISHILSSEPKTINVHDFTIDGQKKKFLNLKDEIVEYWSEYALEITKGVTYTGTNGILFGQFGKSVTGKDSLTIGDITSGYLHTLLKSREAIMDEYPIFNVRGRSEEAYNNMKGNLQLGYNFTVNALAESKIPYLSDFYKGLEGDKTSDWNSIKLDGSYTKGVLGAVGGMVDSTIEMLMDPLKTDSEIADLLVMDGEDVGKIKDQALDYLDKKVKNGTAEERSEFAGSTIANIFMMLLMFKGAVKPKTSALLAEESGVEINVAKEAALKGGKGSSYKSLLGEMSEADAERYGKFLQNGSKAGLTEAEKNALLKVDQQLALNRIDYNEILKSRKQGSVGAISEGGLNSERVEYYLSQSRNNIDSNTSILGSTGKYDVIAERKGYSYFKMEDEVWASLEKEAGNNYDEIWKVNEKFIDEQIAANKKILLSDNPNKGYYFSDGAKRFYQRELDYLSNKGYTFNETSNGMWEAIKK